MSAVSPYKRIKYSGRRAGKIPLTWSQRWLWRAVAAQAPNYAHLNLAAGVEVPAGCDLEDVMAVLSFILERHETLRSRFCVDEHGEPVQLLSAAGELSMAICEAGPSETASMARQLEADLTRMPFTIPEPAVRVAVVTENGKPKWVILGVFEMALDFFGLQRVRGELELLLRSRPEGETQPALAEVSHPLDRVKYEQSPEGLTYSEKAVMRWRREVERFPRTALPPRRTPETLRFQECTMRSKAAAVAVSTLSRAYKVSPGAVVLAHACTLLGNISENSRLGFLLFSHNRFSDDAVHHSGRLAQSVPVSVELSGVKPGDLARAAHRAAVRSAMLCECDPDAVTEMLRDFADRNGFEVDISCAFNFPFSENEDSVWQSGKPQDARSLDVREYLPETKFSPLRQFESEDMRFYLTAFEVFDEISVSLRVDTEVLSSDEIVGFLRSLEGALIDSYLNPNA